MPMITTARHAVGMNVIANLDDAVAGPLNPKMWGRNTTDQAIELLLAAVVDHPAMLAIAYSTEGGMMSFGSVRPLWPVFRAPPHDFFFSSSSFLLFFLSFFPPSFPFFWGFFWGFGLVVLHLTIHTLSSAPFVRIVSIVC